MIFRCRIRSSGLLAPIGSRCCPLCTCFKPKKEGSSVILRDSIKHLATLLLIASNPPSPRALASSSRPIPPQSSFRRTVLPSVPSADKRCDGRRGHRAPRWAGTVSACRSAHSRRDGIAGRGHHGDQPAGPHPLSAPHRSKASASPARPAAAAAAAFQAPAAWRASHARGGF